jgi:hypothetical protein
MGEFPGYAAWVCRFAIFISKKLSLVFEKAQLRFLFDPSAARKK